ncbi:peptidase domain-containing ABC transporter [Pedobacter fastidiosus]|uniref:Peptidase domain-containing ABC transporter n=1 Tax=Pedobacter fastidiosus TaxID=2765361 RepID=A0ABR7KV24_9SPHI|nr:peptidase domain-containing ABC transporter [Pedobacter fastidiosus]MBC6111774.1 peptidase domain-containing ABC transporter [Pedobacter fastidiosus]
MEKKAKRTLVIQQDISDCGVACLLSAIRYFDGNNNLENLRKLSGTDGMGTTLLGLCQSSEKTGIDAEGFEAEIEHLINLKELSILHLTLENDLEHFVLNYGYDSIKKKFLIGDPSKGVEFWDELTLLKLWKSKVLLTLTPNKNFIKTKTENIVKRKWFISLLKDDYNILLSATFLGIVIAGLGLSTALFTQKLVDEIIPKQQISKMISGFGILFILLVAKSGISFLRQLFLLQQTKDFNERINGSFIEKLLHLPKLFFDSRKTGDLISRLNDTMRIQRSVAYLSGTFIIDFLVVVISSVYLFSFHYSIALTALTAIPLMGFIAWKYNDKIITQNTSLMSSYANNESNYIDTIQGINVIKSASKENAYGAKIKGHFTIFQTNSLTLGKTGNRFNLIVEVLATIIIISIMAETAYFTLEKTLKIGEMMAILSIGIGIIPSCTRLMLTNLQIQEAKVAYNRMYEFASIDAEGKSNSLIEKYEWDGKFKKLEIKNLSFRFAGRRQLLTNVSLEVKTGKIVALLGESGCGKSTILQVLQKFYDKEFGYIIINDQFNLDNLPITQWRKTISVVPQEIKIFNCSILENICLSTIETDLKDVFALCEEHGLQDYFNQFPQGLFTRVGEDGLNLSGGQKQILALLRALYSKPQLLLLDEATASLDPKTEGFILNLLIKLKEKMGILLVTHKESTAKIADEVYEVENGIAKNSRSLQVIL